MIYGKRIRLRHIERADLSYFVEWLNDPEVHQGLSLYIPLSQVEEERWFESSLERPPEERPLAIETKHGEDWMLIGNCGFFNIDWRNRNAELGVFIGDKNYWDKGYGTEVIHLLVQHGYDTLNLHRLFLRVYEDNPRAIRAYEKAGFVHESRQRQAVFQEGKYLDILFMSVLHNEWQA